MAYASLSDVSAYAAKRIFGATSIPSATQVAVFLTDTASDLDSIIAADGYALPIPTTATIALADLRRLNALGAYVKVERAAQESIDVDRAQKAWEDARKEFISGGVSLYDAPRLGGENFARSQSAATAFFTRNMPITGLEPQ